MTESEPITPFSAGWVARSIGEVAEKLGKLTVSNSGLTKEDSCSLRDTSETV